MENTSHKHPALTILSLEDSPRDFELIRELLIDEGFTPQMEQVQTQQAFINALHKKAYDIILADFNLPGFDAFTALQKALVICPDTPFIVVSGAIGEETAIELIKQGAVDYVLKDRPQRLISAIERALEEAHQQRVHKRLLKELQTQYAMLNIAGEVAKLGGWRVDLTTNISIWSDTVADIHEVPRGYSPPVEEGIAFYAPEWREKITRVFTDCVEKGIPYDEELEIITKTGKRVWVRTIGRPVRDEDGKIVQIQGAFQDISDRKQAENELRERESLLNKIFNVLPIGLWFADANGTLQKGNPAGIKIWGAETTVPMEEYGVFNARRLPSGEEITPNDWALTHTIRDRVTIKDELLEIDAFDGEKRIILNYTAPVENNQGELLGAIVVNNDITELKRAEDQLRQSEERFRELVNHLPGVVYLCNNDARYTMTYLSKDVEVLTGYPREAFLEGKVSFTDLYHPDDLPEIYRAVDNAVKQHTSFHLAYRLKHRNGDYRWFEEWGTGIYDGDQLRFLEGFMVDVTEQKLLEDTILENERIFQIALKNSPVTVFQQDKDLRYTWINNPFDNIDVSPELGKTDVERFSAEDAAKLTEIKKRVLNNGIGEQQIIESTGNKLPLFSNLTIEPMVDQQGQITGIVGSSVNITEIRLAEAGQRRRLAELELIIYITDVLQKARTVDDALPILLSETLRIMEMPAGSIHLLNKTNQKIEMVASEGWLASLNLSPDDPGEGIVGKVLVNGKTYLTKEFRNDPNISRKAIDQIPPGWGGVAVPIQAMDESIGVFMVSCQLPQRVQPHHVQMLEGLARMVGITLHRMSLLESALNRVEKMQAQQIIDKAIASVYDLKLMGEIIVEQSKRLLAADAVSLLLYKPHSFELTSAIICGFRTNQYQKAIVKVGKGYSGQAALEFKTVHLEDINHNDPPFERADLIAGEDFSCYTAVPLVAKGKLKGMLEIFHRGLFDHNSEWQGYLDSLASQTAVAIEDQLMYDRLQRNNLELTQAYDNTIEGWSLALDLRDKETEGHTLRVAEMTLKLAQAMGLNEEELIHIKRGALLHDMGKLGVPDSILLKPGKLTEDEWVIMKEHPKLAFNMLSPIDYLRPALDIPYCHHEKWDGSGYPRGIKGKTIPLSARIFAVVDVWDALRSDRPYRAAWPEEKVLNYIREQSGSHFDPEVVELFLQIVES